jgi:hypothetical protein
MGPYTETSCEPKPVGRLLGDLVPGGGLAGGEEGVFASVPAEEVGSLVVSGVMIAGFPDFVQEIHAGLIGAAVEIVLKAAFFLARGMDESAELSFEEQILAFACAQGNDDCNGALGELFDFYAVRFTAASGSLRFSFGHDGGDCTPNEGQRKEISGATKRRRAIHHRGRGEHRETQSAGKPRPHGELTLPGRSGRRVQGHE